jgi:hypothetical protein
MKLGIICIVLACFQASNGLARPKKAAPGEHDQFIRKIWMCLHQYMGRAALGLGFITLLTGITQLGERDGFDHVKSLQAALFAWFLLITGLVTYIEICRTRFLLTLLYYHNFLCSVCKFSYCGSQLTVIKSTLC